MSRYSIRGGAEGRERLRILANAWRPATLLLLERAGIRPGMTALDIGCGGGDVAFDLAQLVGPNGRVIAIDIDAVQIAIARDEARSRQIANIEFRVANIDECDLAERCDFAYTRFVLSHLQSPEKVIGKIKNAIRPGGILVAVDTDFRGVFWEPDSQALHRYVALYTELLRRRGGDANLGPRLPGLLVACGFETVQLSVAQNAAMQASEKVLAPLTMEFIGESLIAEGLASSAEIDELVPELYAFANSPNTVLSGPRAIEAWGFRPAG